MAVINERCFCMADSGPTSRACGTLPSRWPGRCQDSEACDQARGLAGCPRPYRVRIRSMALMSGTG
jgi:hypothetical protein